MALDFSTASCATNSEIIDSLMTRIYELEQKLAGIGTRVTPSAVDAFKKGIYGLLCVCPLDEWDRERSDWIKVTPETMPPDNVPILITVNRGGRKIVSCAEDDGNGNFHSLSTEDDCLWSDVYILSEVTHWMPLPEPAEGN